MATFERVDDLGVGQLRHEQVNLGLQEALRFAGAVVLGVFAEVAFGAGRRDPFFDFRHLLVLQMVDLGLELVVAGTGHRDAIGHSGSCKKQDSEWAKKKRPPWGETELRRVFSTGSPREVKSASGRFFCEKRSVTQRRCGRREKIENACLPAPLRLCVRDAYSPGR